MCCITDTGATATTPSSPPGKCNGIPNTDWSCCSDTNYCNLGEGDCDFDLDCAGSLTCGEDAGLRRMARCLTNIHHEGILLFKSTLNI